MLSYKSIKKNSSADSRRGAIHNTETPHRLLSDVGQASTSEHEASEGACALREEADEVNDFVGNSVTSLFPLRTTSEGASNQAAATLSKSQKYSASEAGKLMARIDAQKSVAGMINNIRYTHNTDVAGFMGLLATDRFLATVEPNVNWRLDLDSRYASGVTYIMKRGFFRKYRDYYIDDMYAKGYAFDVLKKKLSKINKETLESPGGGEAKKWEEYFSILTQMSDFRSFQVPEGGLKTTGIKLGSDWTPAQKKLLRGNSKISSVNPQLRIPWQAEAGKPHQKILATDIDLVLITPEAYDSIKTINLAKTFEGFTTKTQCDPNKRGLGLRYDANYAMKKFTEWERCGKIKVLEGTRGLEQYSHDAGREGKRKLQGEQSIKESAKQGLEFHQDFHLPGAGNNSPSAYSLPVFQAMQQEYFRHLIQSNVEKSDLTSEEFRAAYEAEREERTDEALSHTPRRAPLRK